MPDWNVILPAVGILISVVVTAIISYRVASGAAKKTDIDTLRDGYKHLQKTYEEDNARLHNELESERNARRADKLECQTLIDGLQRQLTTLLTKLPEPGTIQPVMIAGIDTAALPALPVKLTDVGADVILPTEIKRPGQPWKMTIAEVEQAKHEAETKGE